jgi:hypothetical protein
MMVASQYSSSYRHHPLSPGRQSLMRVALYSALQVAAHAVCWHAGLRFQGLHLTCGVHWACQQQVSTPEQSPGETLLTARSLTSRHML